MAKVPNQRSMKKPKRRKFSAGFKARVAWETARGVRTINEIAAENERHQVPSASGRRNCWRAPPACLRAAATRAAPSKTWSRSGPDWSAKSGN